MENIELKIAKENFGCKSSRETKEYFCREHKQSCEREEVFLESLIKKYEPNIIFNMPFEMKDRLKDLQETIKFYTGKGI